jgi:hypothetical protein
MNKVDMCYALTLCNLNIINRMVKVLSAVLLVNKIIGSYFVFCYLGIHKY